MKKTALILATILMVPALTQAMTLPPTAAFQPGSLSIPSNLSTSSETSTVQWGCPVMETVHAKNKEEAMQLLSQACMDEAKKAVVKKPGVFDVIHVSVVWPDVNVTADKNGYFLQGTFFLETLVLKSMGAE
jgi:hypothetical protein